MVQLSIDMGIPFHEVREWPAAELALYMAHYRLRPFGEDGENIRSAMLRAQMANQYRPKERQHNPYQFTEFWPWNVEKSRQPVEVDSDSIMSFVGHMKQQADKS